MATIQERKTEDEKISCRVRVRLKGYPPQKANLARITDARLTDNHEKELREQNSSFFVDHYVESCAPEGDSNPLG